MSLLSGAPVSVSTLVKATLADGACAGAVTFHVVSALGPTTVSLPAPPSNATDTAAEAIVNVSAPAPPTIATPSGSSLSSFVVATPSTVTTASVSVVATEIAWSPFDGAVTVQLATGAA